MAPRRIAIINPNTTKDFEAKITQALQQDAPEIYELVSVDVVSPEFGAPSIQSVAESVVSANACLKDARVMQAAQNADGILVACYSYHPLVDILREMYRKPVTGIFHASLTTSLNVGRRIGIVTTDKRWEYLLADGVRALGISEHAFVGVYSSGLSVLDLERLEAMHIEKALVSASQRLVAEKDADVICLGCAGMAGLAQSIQQAVGPNITIVDGIPAGLAQVYSLLSIGARTAKAGAYADLSPDN